MALFDRKKTEPSPAVQRVLAPVVVEDGDLQRADQLLEQFEQAVGDDAATRYAAQAIAQAGGVPSFEQALHIQMETGQTGMDRPWRWLAAVDREAERRGDCGLVARISLFVTFWIMQIDPHLQLGDRLDMQLEKPPRSVLAEVYTIGLRVLPRLDPNAVVVDHPTGTMRVQQLLVGCAQQALGVEELLDSDSVAAARRVLAR
jgi:hypothetical protein